MQEEFGHQVMLAVFDSVDDTKLVEKALLKVSTPIVFLINPLCHPCTSCTR